MVNQKCIYSHICILINLYVLIVKYCVSIIVLIKVVMTVSCMCVTFFHAEMFQNFENSSTKSLPSPVNIRCYKIDILPQIMKPFFHIMYMDGLAMSVFMLSYRLNFKEYISTLK